MSTPTLAAGPFADVTASESTLRRFLEGLPGVDQVGAEARAAGLGTRSIKTTAKAYAIDLAIRMVDLTTLEGADTPGKVRSLVAKAMTPDPSDATTPRVAAVCVYGDMVPVAIDALGSVHGDPDDGLISVAAVATALTRSALVAPLVAMLLGSAYGIAIVSGLLEIQRIAPPDELAGISGVYYSLAYLGFLLPAALAALAHWFSYPVMLSALIVGRTLRSDGARLSPPPNVT